MRKTKKLVAALLLVILFVQVFPVSICAAELPSTDTVQPYYIGIRSLLADVALENESTGYVKCKGSANLRSGYTADLFMDLIRVENDGTEVNIAHWSQTDTATPSMLYYRYIAEGYTYVLYVSVTVYDADGNFVERDTIIDSLVYRAGN